MSPAIRARDAEVGERTLRSIRARWGSLTTLTAFTSWQRIEIFLISSLGRILLQLIGATLRYRVEGWENFGQFKESKKGVIHSFWHNQIFCATHFWRFRNIVVMTSRHFDGEVIARMIERLGFVPARGSSSKGGVKALLELKRKVQSGLDVAFTADGPRGPVCRVKPGPVWLSRKTGAPIVPFHIQPRRFWSLRSWDRFRVPKPFSPVLVKIGQALIVPSDADEESWLLHYQEEMDRIEKYCEAYWKKEEGGRR